MKKMFSNRGSTLVEIMIALGLVGLVSLGIFSLSQETLKTIQSNQLATTRDQLATEFRQSAGRLRNLKNSLTQPGNELFFNCVCGQGSGCDTAKPYDLALYDDSGPPVTTPKPLPLFYDYSGIPCVETASNCAIKVTTGFVAQCKPALPSADPTPLAICIGAPVEFFAVTFMIEQNPYSVKKNGILFKPVKGSAFTQVANFAPAGSGVCP